MASKASTKVVDFTNVKEQGNFNPKMVPAGDYLAEVVKVEDAESKSDGIFMYLFTIKLKKFSQNSYPYYCKLQENQLWKLRNLLIAAGINVPRKRMKLDPSKVIGKVIGVTMEDDEYEGKMKSVVQAIFPAAELMDGNIVDDDDDDDEDVTDSDELLEDDEAASAESAASAASADDAEDEDEDEEDEEEEAPASPYADYDRTRLKREIKKLDSSYSVKRSQSDDDLRAVLAELASEEEEPAPKKAKKSKAKKAAEEVTDDELEELDIDDL